MYLTDEEMDDQDRRSNCMHDRTAPVQVSDDEVIDVCDDCGLALGEPYQPNFKENENE